MVDNATRLAPSLWPQVLQDVKMKVITEGARPRVYAAQYTASACHDGEVVVRRIEVHLDEARDVGHIVLQRKGDVPARRIALHLTRAHGRTAVVSRAAIACGTWGLQNTHCLPTYTYIYIHIYI